MAREPNRDSEQWGAWMAAAQAGDAQAYDRLLRALLPRLRAFVMSRLGDAAAAEDVVQNVLLSIHRARHSYRPERPFAPWLWAIARNAVIDAHRQRAGRARREVAVEDLEAVAPPVEPDEIGESLSPALRGALEALPPTQREAVELLHLKQLSVAEAALQVGVTPGALKVRAHRGYKAMRIRLGTDR
jgi:RNA polymerase sigma-70 factor (ECF subfamily)